MTRVLAIMFAVFASASLAQDAGAADGAMSDLSPVERWQADPTIVFSADEIDIDAFQWLARPVVVFANTPANPAFEEQLNRLNDRIDDLVERDVVIITDTDPEARSELRTRLRPRGFQLTLIGKDGDVELRKPSPWSARELSRSIDKMPLRQQEIREGG